VKLDLIPDNPSPALSERSRKLMQALRRVTYTRDDVLPGPVREPYVFYAPHLCGEYAIFIFGSFRCDKYLKGLCTPCHYSGLMHPGRMPKADVYAALDDQVEHLISRFDELVLARQHGTGVGYRLPRRHPDGRFADLQIAGEGSFLRDGEIPPAYRLRILERFVAFGQREEIDLHIGLEVKAEDILRAEERGEFEIYAERMGELHFSLIMGFESTDPWVRNVIFNKGLALEAVERAIEIGLRRGMAPICFVYAGNHAMTDRETIDDAIASIRWLRARGAGIYLMLPNLQPHTIPHLLYHAGAHDLIDVRSAIPIIDELVAHGHGDSRVHFHAGHDWNIGGVTAEPDPELNIFTNPRRISCAGCVARFRAAVYALASSHDVDAWHAGTAGIRSCACRADYEEARRKQATRARTPLARRVEADLDRVEQLIDGYDPAPTVVISGPRPRKRGEDGSPPVGMPVDEQV